MAKLSGVKAVDLKSMKGHAMVTIDGEKVKAEQLAAAVNGIKGRLVLYRADNEVEVPQLIKTGERRRAQVMGPVVALPGSRPARGIGGSLPPNPRPFAVVDRERLC